MEELLKSHLKKIYPKLVEYHDEGFVYGQYNENINQDALTDAWLDSRTSYIYKVGVYCFIDSNKCDYAYVAIGMQRTEAPEVNIIGTLYFEEGENDDMGRVLERAMKILEYTNGAFER